MALCLIGNIPGKGSKGPTDNWRVFLEDPTTGREQVGTAFSQNVWENVCLLLARAVERGMSIEDAHAYATGKVLPALALKTGQVAAVSGSVKDVTPIE
jgi:hypothetical protein